jgi:ELWxxDGT repeat protein
MPSAGITLYTLPSQGCHSNSQRYQCGNIIPSDEGDPHMLRQTVLFVGTDASGQQGMWVSNGTAADTYELTGIRNASGAGFNPIGFTVLNGEVLLQGSDASGDGGLWATDATAAGTYELTGISGAYSGGVFAFLDDPDLTVLNGEALFDGIDQSAHHGLWVTNGTAAGTHELTGISGANSSGVFSGFPSPDFTVLNGQVLFRGIDTSGNDGLWASNGTAAGTHEITGIGGAYTGQFGLQPYGLTPFNGEVLFEGIDANGNNGLWETDSTAIHTFELTDIRGAYSGGIFSGGVFAPDFTVFNGEVLFEGADTGAHDGLWITNGTTAGTTELGGLANSGIGGAYVSGLFSNVRVPEFFEPGLFVYNEEMLFDGVDAGGNDGLWVTNGTAAGTSELADIGGAGSGGIFNEVTPDFTAFNGEVLFNGYDTAGTVGLWATNGTVAGTRELVRPLSPVDLTSVTLIVPPPDDFNSNNTSDVLFRDTTSGDTWFEAISNGAPRTPSPWQEIGGSDTHYAVLGVGDFYGTGASDILFRNSSTGDTWFEAISNGAFAGWHQIGGSDTHYSVAGVGDFSGYGTSDILFRNNSTGDTWFEAISNGAFNGWDHIGGSDTHYSVVGIGDLFESGVDDILFRNNSTGDTWVEQITNGALAGWDQIGGSDTHYSVAGVGDFFGNGTDDILFRDNSTGDTWFEAITNGASAGWHQIGGSDTTYSVAGVGDYFGNNTSDILFRNSAGDTWVEQITNGAFAGWNQIGGSSTSYSVPITVGPPALT